MTHEELESFTDICDFTSEFYVVLDRSSKWVKLSIESLNLTFHNFSTFKHSFQRPRNFQRRGRELSHFFSDPCQLEKKKDYSKHKMKELDHFLE